MTKPFSEGAEKLSSIAVYLLGWSPDQFWRVTPQELKTVFSALDGEGGKTVTPIDNMYLEKLKDRFPDG
ncbi:MAG: phage tail assembly chaperone [Parasphingorhabdus sp.]